MKVFMFLRVWCKGLIADGFEWVQSNLEKIFTRSGCGGEEPYVKAAKVQARFSRHQKELEKYDKQIWN